MAIIIQENGKKGALVPLLIGFVVIAVMGLLAYYLFFSPAPIVDIVGSDKYESTAAFSKATLDVDSVINSPVWNALQTASPVPALITQIISVRENPFQSP
ncbi:MAG: hypothetical protein WC519_02990 [Parcubacteria group bacterium]